jgi:hypothetical protein
LPVDIVYRPSRPARSEAALVAWWRGTEAPRPGRYRFNRLACEAIRWRLRFLTDRRRRFMPLPIAGLNGEAT